MIQTSDLIINDIDESKFNYLKNEINDNPKSVLGVEYNKIVEIPNFVNPDTARHMIMFFEDSGVDWGPIAFYGSEGKGIKQDQERFAKYQLSNNFFAELTDKFSEAVETVFGRKVKPNTSHAQKWEVGGFASPHSDNSDLEGVPNSFQINKYVGVLYLNDDYEGGELTFPEHGLVIKPNKYSYYVFCGGIENIHAVEEITKGTRYTMVSFWDYADAEYSQETLDAWAEELKEVRAKQEKQREDWANGNKYA